MSSSCYREQLAGNCGFDCCIFLEGRCQHTDSLEIPAIEKHFSFDKGLLEDILRLYDLDIQYKIKALGL